MIDTESSTAMSAAQIFGGGSGPRGAQPQCLRDHREADEQQREQRVIQPPRHRRQAGASQHDNQKRRKAAQCREDGAAEAALQQAVSLCLVRLPGRLTLVDKLLPHEPLPVSASGMSFTG
jgi:hypothetical protein